MSHLGIIPSSSMRNPTYYFITKSRFDRNMDNLHNSISSRLDCLLTTSGSRLCRSFTTLTREKYSLFQEVEYSKSGSNLQALSQILELKLENIFKIELDSQ
ncbi:unnamed protein product [Microthlaspi erraticum]|uniref:Uncharacterized protein n=1 Tax=Microthlaspi erraticum TaxID=1685480 RepID=A0A6D2J3P1_9BRAS|nr:unnamed protein product [Microthlaspi erraticum]